MKILFKSRNLYKLIVIVFLIFTIVKIRSQIVVLNSYNAEISSLNEKITVLQQKKETNITELDDTRKNNEDIARKELKMYYPNETPYKGY